MDMAFEQLVVNVGYSLLLSVHGSCLCNGFFQKVFYCQWTLRTTQIAVRRGNDRMVCWGVQGETYVHVLNYIAIFIDSQFNVVQFPRLVCSRTLIYHKLCRPTNALIYGSSGTRPKNPPRLA